MIREANRINSNELKKLYPYLKKKCLFVGIGNISCGDDGIGPEIITILKTLPNIKSTDRYSLIDTGTTPENYFSKMINIQPEIIILIDAVLFNQKPGSIKIIIDEEIDDTTSSTHNASLKLIKKFILASLDIKVILMGIQPENINFGEGLSLSVQNVIEEIKKFFYSDLI